MVGKEEMIQNQLLGRDIKSEKVIEAMKEVDRKDFLPDDMHHLAYEDRPLPIGKGQTISQPYIVAYMSQALDLKPDDKVLEIGSGCGYNAAVMSRLAKQVHSVEIIDWLAHLARENLEQAGISNVTIHVGDGYLGLPELAPFDKIILTAAAPYVPRTLKQQLKIGGKLLAPVGISMQKLVIFKKVAENDFETRNLVGVRFVPMTGKAL